jgi:hypothetical protein
MGRRVGVLCLALGLSGFGCGSSDSTVDSGGSPDGGSPAAEAGIEAPKSALSFKPSNVDLAGLDLSKVADVVITGSNNFVNAETGDLALTAKDKFVFKSITRQDSTRIGLFVVKSLRVEANSTFAVMGLLPVVIVALDNITVAGTFEVPPGTGGGGVQSMENAKGAGTGGGPGAVVTGMMIYGGGGGSFCGVGGAGALQGGGAPGMKSTAYGTPDLVPLVPGSSGGTGAIGGNTGNGGGAVQLTAGAAISVISGGIITAPGAGGGYGAVPHLNQEGGGAGSGGAILLEAPTVSIAGVVAANAGGGGPGAGNTGEKGKPSADPALGGMGTNNMNSGGQGGAGDKPDGADGSSAMGLSAGGGGGGEGRIRINTMSGQATISGTVSPSTKTSCLSQGMLAK